MDSLEVLVERIVSMRRDLDRMEEGLRWLRRAVMLVGLGLVGTFLTANVPSLFGG